MKNHKEAMMRLFFTLLLLFQMGRANAQNNNCSAKEAAKHIGVDALLLGGVGFTGLEKVKLAGDSPRWTDETLNPLDRAGQKLRWARGLDTGAESLSNFTLALTPLSSAFVAFAGESKGACFLEDVSLFAETIGVAVVLNQTTKFIARRERPFSHDLSAQEQQSICLNENKCVDLNLSFFSGHSTLTFASAFAAGTIARERGYKSATAAYTFGVLGAGLTAYLRVAAGKHYLSDVLVGAVVGSAVGVLVPLYIHPLHSRRRENISLLPLGAKTPGLSLSGTF
jgi:membrane-associated phospholipid phosphatase